MLNLSARFATHKDQEHTTDTFLDLISDLDAANPALGHRTCRDAIAADLEQGERFLALINNTEER
jgi:hypothetical protein